MLNNIKKEIENEFDKEKNYRAILSKVERVSNMKNFKVKYALVPICIILIAVVGIGGIELFNKQPSENEKWPIKNVNINDATNEDLAIIPHWDEMTISQQFQTVNYNGNNFDSKNTQIPYENIEKSLGTATLTGYDTYTNTHYSKNASLYKIKTISEQCAIALQFEGTSEYYSYINAYYRPETLNQFINDLNLKEIISFDSIWYNYSFKDEKGNLQFEVIEFPEVSDKTIWEMLFSDTNVKNEFTDNNPNMYPAVMSVSTNIPLLGYQNISVWVTENGYLVTNILDTGKGFYIGKENVQKFIDYVIKNCEGFKIVYNNQNIDEENNNGNSVNEKDEIVVMKNTIMENINGL